MAPPNGSRLLLAWRRRRARPGGRGNQVAVLSRSQRGGQGVRRGACRPPAWLKASVEPSRDLGVDVTARSREALHLVLRATNGPGWEDPGAVSVEANALGCYHGRGRSPVESGGKSRSPAKVSLTCSDPGRSWRARTKSPGHGWTTPPGVVLGGMLALVLEHQPDGRSRNSWGYLPGRVIAPTSHESEPPQIPGRLSIGHDRAGPPVCGMQAVSASVQGRLGRCLWLAHW